MNIPKELLYSNDHEWVRVEDKTAVIGITDFAQNQLGDVVFVELPENGADLEAGDVLSTIESVKAVSEVYCPVAGKVIDVNETLADNPEKVNENCYGTGWVAVVEMTNPADLEELLDPEAYEKLLAEEE